MERIYNGHWDGEAITRPMTAREQLARALEGEKNETKEAALSELHNRFMDSLEKTECCEKDYDGKHKRSCQSRQEIEADSQD